MPAELEHSGSELLLGSSDNEFVTPEERYALRLARRSPAGLTACFSVPPRRLAESRSAKPPADDRDWRSRSEAAPPREVRAARRQPVRAKWRLSFSRPPRQSGNGGGGGGGGGKRGNLRSSSSKGEGMVDRTPLPAGEAGAEIVRAANPWTRAGPADELERLRRNVKGYATAATCSASLRDALRCARR